MRHICVSKLTIIGSDKGLSPGRCQAIIWSNAGILLIETLGTNYREILSEIHTFSFKKIHLKMSSAKWRSFCQGLNVLNNIVISIIVCSRCQPRNVYLISELFHASSCDSLTMVAWKGLFKFIGTLLIWMDTEINYFQLIFVIDG